MSAVTRAMYELQDEDVRRKVNREFFGPEVDDEIRKVLGIESYYDQQAREENERYWTDYIRNTGADPRYPIRTGSDWNRPIDTIPMMAKQGKRAIDMLYGGQE